MAKTLNKWDAEHQRRLNLISRRVSAIYNEAVKEAAKLGVAITPDFNPDKPFTFADYPNTRKKINNLMTGLKSDLSAAVINGIDSEWTLANDKNNELSNFVFGENVSKLTPEQQRRYFSNNDAARRAFIFRKENGLNLSERVWRFSEQFKTEIEMGLDLGIRNGLAADDMARDLKQYLVNPDKLFRRVRDEHGQLHLSKAAAAFHPGQGVYRSSYKNARRLAVTETNMAYRSSDNLRIAQLDFVVGIEIRLSNNHTLNGVVFSDICDSLAGRYPKSFKFIGWHPHCRCNTVTILKTAAELKEDTQRILAGETPGPESVNRVSDVPPAFKKWVTDNSERIKSAKSMPYFLADNQGLISTETGEMLAPVNTIKERAARRHAQRTTEKAREIADSWHNRQRQYASIEKEARGLYSSLEGIKDVDTSVLMNALSRYDLMKVKAEAVKLKATKAEIQGLVKLDDPFKVAREYSLADAKSVNKAVTDRMSREHFSSLMTEKKWLQEEIRWVEEHKRYNTWPAARDAYRKELAFVTEKLEIEELNKKVADALNYCLKTTDEALKKTAEELKTLLGSAKIDIKQAKTKADELIKQYTKIAAEEKAALRKLKASNATIETLDDLKTRLGDRLPKTLPGLNDAIDEYESLGRVGTIAKENKDEIEDLMRDIFSTHDLGMNVDDVTLKKILDTKFKNLFEVGTGNGATPEFGKTTGPIGEFNSRLRAAHKLFGIGDPVKNQLARGEYEKYGNLLDHDIERSMRRNTAQQYGNVEVRFKKDKVTCTWTAGDSLGQTYQPSLVTDPKACSFDSSSMTPTKEQIELIDVSDLTNFKRHHINSYIELQYHGEITVDCVESLTFPYELKASQFESVALEWKAKGVKVYYIGNDSKLHEFKGVSEPGG